MLGYKKPIRKGKSHISTIKKDIIYLPKPEPRLNQSTKKNVNVIDFIKQKNRFIIENVFDLKGTREFLASKEVAMRVIKLNDEIIEDDKIDYEDSDIRDKYNTNIDSNLGDHKKKVKKKISTIPIKSKFSSNKELFLDLDLRKVKKEFKKIKDKMSLKESKNNLSPKSKTKRKKSKKSKNESSEYQDNINSPKKRNNNNNIGGVNLTSQKKDSSSFLPRQKQTQSQFMFSEINKKLMADDEINLSGISNKNFSPKSKSKSKMKDGIYQTEINNFNNFKIFNEKVKNQIDEEIIEEDRSKNEDKVDIFQLNSDKESLISILSDLM